MWQGEGSGWGELCLVLIQNDQFFLVPEEFNGRELKHVSKQVAAAVGTVSSCRANDSTNTLFFPLDTDESFLNAPIEQRKLQRCH